MTLKFLTRLIPVAAACLMAAACQTLPGAGEREPFAEAPQITPSSPTGVSLESLPPPVRPIDVALYNFPDLTGQNRPNDTFAEYSRAVTQGGSAFVIDALNRAGGGKWFNVIERGGLQSLLQERQLIRATRQEYQGAKAAPLPPLRFAGLLLEGGILAYDANTITGGLGARYLGIGGDTKYRRDTVTIALRVVSVQSGQVLLSVTTTKTIYSILLEGNIYKFVALDRILESETGFSKNEPTQLAVREAIELAVYALIMEGAEKNLWHFKSSAGARLVKSYRDSGALRVRADLEPGQTAPDSVVRTVAATTVEPTGSAQSAFSLAAGGTADRSSRLPPTISAERPDAIAPEQPIPTKRVRTASLGPPPLPSPPSPGLGAPPSSKGSAPSAGNGLNPILLALVAGAAPAAPDSIAPAETPGDSPAGMTAGRSVAR